ncbi:hypothetical protein SDC9_89605 [bioreactor metagenome]|uniref:Uncharacterized protein n=1 Tax=bioreactor metagenome TaxID=1076179 RepID=A0A644ZWB9_9ZZZZ
MKYIVFHQRIFGLYILMILFHIHLFPVMKEMKEMMVVVVVVVVVVDLLLLLLLLHKILS